MPKVLSYLQKISQPEKEKFGFALDTELRQWVKSTSKEFNCSQSDLVELAVKVFKEQVEAEKAEKASQKSQSSHSAHDRSNEAMALAG